MSTQNEIFAKHDDWLTSPPPETSTEIHTYRYYDYDVWGDDDDGYTVNDVICSDIYVEIPDNASDFEICQILKRKGLVRQDTRTRELVISSYGDNSYDTIVIDDANLGMPLFELRKED